MNKYKKSNTKDNNFVNKQFNIENMDITTTNLENIFKKSSDIRFTKLMVNTNDKLPVTLVFVEGLVNNSYISQYIMRPLTEGKQFKKAKTLKNVLNLIELGAIYYSQQHIAQNMNDVINSMMIGCCALIFDDEKTAVMLKTRGYSKRNIGTPTEEGSLKGSKDAFVETLRVNTGIIRRRISNPNLVIEETTVGKQSNTFVAIVYIDGITNENIVSEVKKRIDKIDIDKVMSPNHIEHYIIDNKFTIFPMVHYTEKPNVFCSSIIEGKVGIIIDGIPFTIITPVNFFSFFVASDDHSYNYIVVSFFRLIAYGCYLISLLLPGFFISITTFNAEMIPTSLAMSIAATQREIPFPIFIETIVMLFLFFILLLSAARLLKSVGNAVSVVGGLVLGEAAIVANLVSPSVIVVVSLTVICSLALANTDLMLSVWVSQFLIVLLSSIAGLFGLTIGSLIILIHLSKIETLGVPYLSPVIANDYEQMDDLFIKLPESLIKKRPAYLKTTNTKRQN